jgi:hypothetical protein
MMPLSLQELEDMRQVQQGAMLDTGQFLRYSETYDAMNHPRPAWTDGSITECGLEQTGGKESRRQSLGNDATTVTWDARLRLPLGSVIDLRDRFRILLRYGQACAPLVYDFAGPAKEGPSGIVIDLKLVQPGV